MLLGPFRRADQARLLGVPARIDERALRPPAGLGERADGFRLLHQDDIAGKGIVGAEHPAVVVIAAHDPLIRIVLALHDGDDVVDGLLAPVRLDQQVDRRRADAADMVRDRQHAAEIGRGHAPASRFQQGFGVRIGDRQGRDLQNGFSRLAGEALGVLGRADAGGERIAGIDHHLLDRAALHALGRTLAALRPDVVRAVAVIRRVRIDQAADGAVLLRQLGFEPPPARAITGDDDLAAHRHAHPLQRDIVLRHAVVHID